MTRHPIERTVERAANGLFAGDVGLALARVQQGQPANTGDREVLKEAHGLFERMISEEVSITSSDHTRRLLDMFEVANQRLGTHETDQYLSRLEAALRRTLEEDVAWDDDLMEVVEFFSSFSAYEQGKASDERGGCF